MVVLVAVIFGLLFSFFIYLSLYIRVASNKGRFQMIDWFLISLATFNGLGFSFIIWATHEGKNAYIWTPWILGYTSGQAVTYLVLNVILAASAFIGWYLTRAIYKLPNKQIDENEIAMSRLQFLLRKTRLVAWFMLYSAILTYWIYTIPYGGFKGLLEYSRLIRSGIFVIDNPYSFLQRFGGFAFFSSYIFFGFLIDKDNKNVRKKSDNIGFVVSFIFSIFVLYSWVGRIAFVVYIATFLLGYALYINKSIFGLFRRLLTLAITGFIAIVFFDKILKRSDEGMSVIRLFAKELSFPVASFIVHIDIQHYRWFKDILVAPLFILPMRIWSGTFNIETASMFNTLMFLGARKGESGITGSVPVDMLTFSYIQAPIVGIILVGLLWGGLLVFLERLINRIPIRGVRTVILGNIVLNVVVLSVLYGDPLHIITRNFDMIIGLSFLLFLLKYSFRLRTGK